MLLGVALPVGIAEALRRQQITAMQGCQVQTRNNKRTDEGRTCDIYIREGTDATDHHS